MMKKYSYLLFPRLFNLLGTLLILLAILDLVFFPDNPDADQITGTIGGALALLVIGLTLVTFRIRLSASREKHVVKKEYRVLGLRLSGEQINVPPGADTIVLKNKQKKGICYVQAAVGFGYTLQSVDIFLSSGKKITRIINTDRKRAGKIAEFLQNELGLEYHPGNTETSITN